MQRTAASGRAAARRTRRQVLAQTPYLREHHTDTLQRWRTVLSRRCSGVPYVTPGISCTSTVYASVPCAVCR